MRMCLCVCARVCVSLACVRACHPCRFEAAPRASRANLGFIVDVTVPLIVLPPKTGTVTVCNFINSCRSGRVSPLQRGFGAHRPVSHMHAVPPRSAAVAAMLREPVSRFVSMLNWLKARNRGKVG